MTLESVEPIVVVLEMSRNSMRNYNYLVVDPKSRCALVVDPAWQMEKLEAALVETGARLKGVLLTHSHHDHIDLARDVGSKYRCPIWMSQREIAYSGFSAPSLHVIGHTPLQVGYLVVRPLHSPGHTPGSVCYHIGGNLFTGDVLFAEGCGFCSDVNSAYEMFDTLERLKITLSSQTRVYPGHTYGKPPGQQFGCLLRDNIYLQFKDREMFAAFRLRSNKRAMTSLFRM